MSDLKKLIRKNWRLIVAVMAGLILLTIVEDLFEEQMLTIDVMAHDLIVVGMRREWLTPLMEEISNIATPLVLIVICLVIIGLTPGRRPGWCVTLNLVLVLVINQALKFIIQRPRPDVAQRLVSASGYSFPSGHSMISMAFFGLLIWLVWHQQKDRRVRIAICLAFSVLIVLIGFSRVYLGVHYASDVIAGFCVSLLWLAFYTKVIAPLLL